MVYRAIAPVGPRGDALFHYAQFSVFHRLYNDRSDHMQAKVVKVLPNNKKISDAMTQRNARKGLVRERDLGETLCLNSLSPYFTYLGLTRLSQPSAFASLPT